MFKDASRDSLAWACAACSECAAGTAMGGRVGSRAPMPLPRALRGFSDLLMAKDLFGELDIAFSPLGAGVVGEDGFAETGCLGEADAARDHSAEDLVFGKLCEIG